MREYHNPSDLQIVRIAATIHCNSRAEMAEIEAALTDKDLIRRTVTRLRPAKQVYR